MSDAPRPRELLLTHHAERELLNIPHEPRQRIKADILRLAAGALPSSQLKKLHGFTPAIWQLTTGEFRVLYRRGEERFVILRVVHKPDQLRVLRSLR